MRRITVFDTDLGTDDALALLLFSRMFAGEQIVLTSFGNVPESQAYENVGYLLPLYGSNAAVFRGAKEATGPSTPVSAAHVHGSDGLGGATEILKANCRDFRETKGDLDALIAYLSDSDAEILDWISLGPTSNLANLMWSAPTLYERIRQVTLMSGAFFDRGNIKDNAEFNAYSDPFALNTLFESGRSLLVVPLDVCRKVQFPFPELKTAFSREADLVANVLTLAHQKYCESYIEWEGFFGCFPHDSIATLAAWRAEDFFSLSGVARCQSTGVSAGTTTMRLNSDGPHSIITGGSLKPVRDRIRRLGKA